MFFLFIYKNISFCVLDICSSSPAGAYFRLSRILSTQVVLGFLKPVDRHPINTKNTRNTRSTRKNNLAICVSGVGLRSGITEKNIKKSSYFLITPNLNTFHFLMTYVSKKWEPNTLTWTKELFSRVSCRGLSDKNHRVFPVIHMDSILTRQMQGISFGSLRVGSEISPRDQTHKNHRE